MALRIPWDIEEAVIMLDMLLKSMDGKLTRKEAIRQVSEKLRKRAAAKGIEIDDVFRNENGITFQMSALEVAYTGIATKLKKPTKLFMEAVDLYRNHREDYDKILREAEDMAEPKSVKDDFFAYLSTQMPSAQLSDAYMMFLDIESFCLQRKVLKKGLFETTDLDIIKQVAQTVDSNKVFRFTYKRNQKKMSNMIHAYCNYLKDHPLSEEKETGMPSVRNVSVAEKVAPAITVCGDGKTSGISTDASKQISQKKEQGSADYSIVDFYNLHSMAFTRPLSFSYFESQPESVDNWTKLYVKLMNCLVDDYPHVLDVSKISRFGGNGRIDYGSGDAIDEMTDPKQLENGCAIETNFSSTDIVKKLKFILELCNVDFENVEIRYSALGTSGAVMPMPNQDKIVPVAEPSRAWPDGEKVDFYENATYAFTKPLAFRYFGEEYLNVRSWSDIYVQILQCLNREFPDVFQRLVGTNVNGTGAIDFGGVGDYYAMRSPKKVTGDIYVETNMDSTDITRKIRRMLDLCGVNYANVEIVYASTKDASVQSKIVVPSRSRVSSVGIDGRQQFDEWMHSVGTASTTIPNYLSAFGKCARSVKEYKIYDRSLWEVTDADEAKRIYDQLFGIPEFYEYNKQQHNRFSAAFRKFIEFRSGGNTVGVRPMQTTYTPVESYSVRSADDPILIRYKELLEKFFSKGFRMDSSLDMKKLRRFYQSQYEEELSDDESDIYRDIRCIAILHEGKAYLPDTMLSREKAVKLEQYIADAFASGCEAIYYSAMFSELEIDFQGERIYNPDMLKTYLSYINHGKYVLQRSYIAKDYTVQMKPEDEVREYLKEAGVPVEVSQLSEALSYIPEKKIKWALSTNGDFIWNEIGVYFHESCFQLSNSELEWISQFIEDSIEERSFVTGNELVEAVEVRFPDIKEMYQQLTVVGKRNAIAYKLRDRFSFNGNIISTHGEALSMAEVYAKYCRKHSRFTLDELNVLKQELGATIYFDAIYDNSLRISLNEFVSQDMAQFNVEETDEAIERICTGQYMSVQAVQDFGTFPYAGYPWNEFLLEHFVANYSHKFTLLHIGYNANLCAGAIVKQSAAFKDFDDLLVDILANSNIELNETAALEYLRQKGYIARRRYSEIGKILTEAKVVRSKKG